MMHNIISDKDKVVSCQLAMGLWSSGATSLVAWSTCLNCFVYLSGNLHISH